ncbi:hypothetical protein Dimus_023784 [Dionaea muscipula]
MRYAYPTQGWNPVLRKKYRNDPVGRNKDSTESKWITIFVNNIPEAMGQNELKKLFSKFGVVMDAFIPRKRSKAGKLFGFVRYSCSVAAEVAIQKTNGLWIQSNQLKVKVADFGRNQRNRVEAPITKVASRWVPKEAIQHRGSKASSFPRDSYATAVKKGAASQEPNMPVVKGVYSGNGWLYRSAVATFEDHRTPDILLDSFTKQERGDISVRRGEDEQPRSDSMSVDGDDVEEGTNGRNLGSREDCSRLLITGSPIVTDGNHDKVRNTYSLGEGEMRGFVLAADEEMNQQVGLDLGKIGGSGISGGELTLYNEAQVGRNGTQSPIGPTSGPVYNTRGINLEVVLSLNIGPVNNGLNNTGLISEAHQVSPNIRNEFDSEGEMEETTGAQLAGCSGTRLHPKIRGNEYTGISQGDVQHEQNNDGCEPPGVYPFYSGAYNDLRMVCGRDLVRESQTVRMPVVVCEGPSEDVHGEIGHGEGVIWRASFAGLSWVVVWLALGLPSLCMYRCQLQGSWLCRHLHRLIMVAFDSSSLFGSAMMFHHRTLVSPSGLFFHDLMMGAIYCSFIYREGLWLCYEVSSGTFFSSPGFVSHDLLMGALLSLGRGLSIFIRSALEVP